MMSQQLRMSRATQRPPREVNFVAILPMECWNFVAKVSHDGHSSTGGSSTSCSPILVERHHERSLCCQILKSISCHIAVAHHHIALFCQCFSFAGFHFFKIIKFSYIISERACVKMCKKCLAQNKGVIFEGQREGQSHQSHQSHQ